MLRRRLVDQGRNITMDQRYVRISHNPNGSRDVFLYSVGGICTCSRFIRNPRRSILTDFAGRASRV